MSEINSKDKKADPSGKTRSYVIPCGVTSIAKSTESKEDRYKHRKYLNL